MNLIRSFGESHPVWFLAAVVVVASLAGGVFLAGMNFLWPERIVITFKKGTRRVDTPALPDARARLDAAYRAGSDVPALPVVSRREPRLRPDPFSQSAVKGFRR
jgi:hypothetical protein